MDPKPATHVLVIDASEQVATHIAALLIASVAAPIQVAVARNSHEAVVKALLNPPAFVLIDLDMPAGASGQTAWRLVTAMGAARRPHLMGLGGSQVSLHPRDQTLFNSTVSKPVDIAAVAKVIDRF